MYMFICLQQPTPPPPPPPPNPLAAVSAGGVEREVGPEGAATLVELTLQGCQGQAADEKENGREGGSR